jgi:hypothetical protein
MPKNVIAEGSQTEVVFIEELVEGTIPTSGTVYAMRKGSETFDAARPTEFDSDIASDGQKSSTIRGLNTLTGGFQTQLANGIIDPFARSALRQSAFTERSYDAPLSITSVSGKTMQVTFPSQVSISGMIVGGLIKFGAGFSAANAGVHRIVSANSTTGVLTVAKIYGSAEDVSDFATQTTFNGEIDERYIKSGGSDIVSFTVEKRFQPLNRDNQMVRLAGERVGEIAVSSQPGGAIDLNVTMMGIKDTLANDGIVGPSNWTVDGGFSAGVSTINITGGSTNPAAGDKLCFADDETATIYTATAGSGTTVDFTPALRDNLTTATKIYFTRPGVDLGDDKKMESILSAIMFDSGDECATAFNLTYTSSLQPRNCIGNENADGFSAGDRLVTGTLTPYLSSDLLPTIAKIRNGTTFGIAFYCRDTSGNCVAFQVPKAEGDKELAKISDQNSVMQNIPFKGLKDETTGATLIIHCLEA